MKWIELSYLAFEPLLLSTFLGNLSQMDMQMRGKNLT